MPGCGHLLEDAGLVGGMQADREEDRLGAVRGERGKDGQGVFRPGAIVEGELPCLGRGRPNGALFPAHLPSSRRARTEPGLTEIYNAPIVSGRRGPASLR